MHKLLKDKVGESMFLLGNEAIARGAIEAGVAFTSTYPGTPSSELSFNFFQISKESDLYFEYSTNEKVALEVAAAAANCGIRSMCMMKHVGLNVAADALMTLAYVGITGSLVILTADDPYMFSSQNEQDNRYYAKFGGLPMLEPSSVEEAKEMIKEAFELSEKLKRPVIFRTTTRINHSTGIVRLDEIKERKTKGDFKKEPLRCVTVPAVSRNLHIKLLEDLEKAQKLSESSPFNFVEGKGGFGLITNGVSYNYAKDAIRDLKAEDKIKILRLGFTNPMPEKIIKDFLKDCEKALIIEEGEAFMEEAIKAFAQEEGLKLEIAGKSEKLFSRLFEFNPALVRKNMADFFGFEYQAEKAIDTSDLPNLPARPPTLCPGCSHRSVFYAAKKACEGMDVIFPSDIGCYTLGFLPPIAMGDFVVCMGASAGTSCGFSQVTDKKVVAFIGDSTFFHSGIAGLINGVFNNHNYTLVILDNRITAMTGHQPNPGVDMQELAMDNYNTVDIESIVKAIGVKHVSVVRGYNVRRTTEAIREAVNFEGVSVVIAREKCVLYAKSLKQLKNNAFQVDPDKCKNHRECINALGCPAFYIENNQVKIHAHLCTACSLCAQVCPEKAIVPAKSL